MLKTSFGEKILARLPSLVLPWCLRERSRENCGAPRAIFPRRPRGPLQGREAPVIFENFPCIPPVRARPARLRFLPKLAEIGTPLRSLWRKTSLFRTGRLGGGRGLAFTPTAEWLTSPTELSQRAGPLLGAERGPRSAASSYFGGHGPG